MQDVIAAINMEPSLISKLVPLTFEICFSFRSVVFSNTFLNSEDASFNKTLSCGLFGPDIVGTIEDISSETLSVNSMFSLAHNPCSFAYFSTVETTCSLLPENLRYFKVSSSIGKKPQVAPYSGAIFAMVALSASVKFFNPSP